MFDDSSSCRKVTIQRPREVDLMGWRELKGGRMRAFRADAEFWDLVGKASRHSDGGSNGDGNPCWSSKPQERVDVGSWT